MSGERGKDVLFFDLDGTLIDSQVGITACIAYALQKMEYPVPPQDTLRGWIGPSLRTTFMPLFGEPWIACSQRQPSRTMFLAS